MLSRYCISVFASDGTGETEFVLFDRVATRAVSKSLTTLLNQRYPGYTTAEEIGNVARFDMTIPPEISRLVGQKYKLMVTISKKWKSNPNENLSFQVNRIEETYKPELPPLVIRAAAESGGASSSGSGSVIQLPPVILPSLPVASPPVSVSWELLQFFHDNHRCRAT